MKGWLGLARVVRNGAIGLKIYHTYLSRGADLAQHQYAIDGSAAARVASSSPLVVSVIMQLTDIIQPGVVGGGM